MKFAVILILGFLLATGGVGLFLAGSEMNTMVMNGEVSAMALKEGHFISPADLGDVVERAKYWKVWGFGLAALGVGLVLFAFATRPRDQK